jgi:hypothetical protein
VLLFSLALPLASTTSYAADSNPQTHATYFIDISTPIETPVSKHPATDKAITNEIFRMVLADTNTDYNMIASANNEVVTLDVTSTNRFELQRMVNGIWQLRGVEQVKNKHGADVASTLAEKFTIAR